jgi:hypothetical protein
VGSGTWYEEGLHFECTRCGNCCGGGPGTILVTDDEIGALATHLGISDAELRAGYTRRLRNGDISLIESDDYDCIFFDRRSGCRVYRERPRQCHTWPFWRSVVFSRETWQEAGDECPGIGSGPRHDPVDILEIARNDGTSGRPRRVEPR